MTALCERYEENGTLARYVARDIDDAEATDFENHYLTCERCQRSIEVGSTVRATDAMRAPRRRLAIPAVLLTAAAAAGLMLGVQGWQRASLRSLGVLETPPVYLGAAMRGDNSGAATQFEAAMSAYSGGDYINAARVLRTVEQSTNEPAAAFFRGASLLMSRDARAAHAEFSRVIDAGDNLYRDEALYYRAKASLLMGGRAAAEQDLKLAVQTNTPIKSAAAELLEQLSK